jgi:hypothetical protein
MTQMDDHLLDRPPRSVVLTAVAASLSAALLAGCASPSATAARADSSPRHAQAATSRGPWQLVSPVQAAGLPLDQQAESSSAYDQDLPTVSGANEDLQSAGHATSTVFAIYELKSASPGQAPQLVILAGYNGTFDPSAVMAKAESHTKSAKVTTVATGPHGGSAICGISGAGASASGACFWVTPTTYAAMLETGTGAKAVSGMPALMIKMRADVEVQAGAAPSTQPGQLLVRASGTGNGKTPSFVASTDALRVTYSFGRCAAILHVGVFQATLTPAHRAADSYDPLIANQVAKGKTVSKIVDAPLGGGEYYVAVTSECTWTIEVRTT